MKKAYFAAGCFWCITPVIKEEKGVEEVYAGYCGGDEENPTYKDVKSQSTGHRETIMVEYNETVLPYRQLVEAFIENVDPFDDGGQYIDRGFSYTLAIYYENNEEREIAKQCIKAVEEKEKQKSAIAIEPLKKFYLAEEDHQNYYLKHPKEFEEELIVSGRKKQ